MNNQIIEQIRELYNEGLSIKEIMIRLNVSRSQIRYYTSSKYDEIHIRKAAKDMADKEFEELVKRYIPQSNSINHLCSFLGLRGVEGYYKKIQNIIDKYNLNTSHFGTIKRNNLDGFNILGDEEYFTERSVKMNAQQLIRRLVNHGYKEYKCEICGINEWQGRPLRLQVHHINGEHYDNRLENLQILCPNCHSQTDNYAGKNSGKKNDKTFLVTQRVNEITNQQEKILENLKLKTKCQRRKSSIPAISKIDLQNGVDEGLTQPQLAERFNCSMWCIKQLVARYHIVSSSRRFDKTRRDEYIEYMRHYTVKEFMTKYNITKKTYYDWKHKLVL